MLLKVFMGILAQMSRTFTVDNLEYSVFITSGDPTFSQTKLPFKYLSGKI